MARGSAGTGGATAAGSDATLNRGQVASWCLFDFANSSYSAVIVGMEGGLVFYNSFRPQIAPPQARGGCRLADGGFGAIVSNPWPS